MPLVEEFQDGLAALEIGAVAGQLDAVLR